MGEADGSWAPRAHTAAGWDKRWTKSSWKESEGTAGEWKWTAGKFYGNEAADKGIQTTPDARFYAIGASFPKFSNAGKDLVLQARGARWPGRCAPGAAPLVQPQPPPPPHCVRIRPRVFAAPRSFPPSTSRSWTAAAAT